jgi:hypothetical protein
MIEYRFDVTNTACGDLNGHDIGASESYWRPTEQFTMKTSGKE